jgi:hypothetical protein
MHQLRCEAVEQRHDDRKCTHPLTVSRVEQEVDRGEEDERINQQQHRVFARRLVAPDQCPGKMGQQEEQEYRGLENDDSAAFLVMVVFNVPEPKE